MASWRIPITDLTPSIAAQRLELTAALERVVSSGRFIGGPEVAGLEQELAGYLGVACAVGVNSGTDALTIGLRALGAGPGQEVIVPAFSFVATAEAVCSAHAQPVFVDIDPATFNIDPEQVRAAITRRTRGIVPVHLYGQAAAMAPIAACAAEHGLWVLEDVAQALGARYRGRHVGSLGDAAAFSFFPSKTLGAFGDAGLLATGRENVAAAARRLRQHGGDDKYRSQELGYNSRLDALQAAVLRVKLQRLDHAVTRRREAAARYDALLAGVTGVETPLPSPDAEHAFYQYTVRLPPGRRDAARACLRERGIQAEVYYPAPLHQLPAYQRFAPHRSLIHSEAAARSVLSLPLWPEIPLAAQVDVAEALRDALGRAP